MKKEEKEERKEEVRRVWMFAGLVFVACIFFGPGVGLFFGRPDIGACIGMGIGLLSVGLIQLKGIKPTPVTISLPKSFGQVVFCVIGILMIICGLCVLYDRPDLLYPYVEGIGIIIVGMLILLAGLTGWYKKE
jgi:uncharacterized membrane protein HdeD (DUF308 family)